MGRKRTHTRRTPQARPRGILEVAADGFGFVSTAEGDFFVPASKMAGALDGDLVELAPAKGRATKGARESEGRAGKRPAARVLRVINRAHDTIVGRYEIADPFGVVVPEDPRIGYDIFTMRSDNPEIPQGAIVRVRMVEYPSRNTAATGVVEDVLGMDGEPGMDVEAIIARHKLETTFSSSALDLAAAAKVDVEGALASGYLDERSRFTFTIDPVDARDFDDSLSVEKKDDGRMLLGIHIADVSHYVPWGCAIDLDARRRATSVYLVDRVIPMLPEALSNEVCSLVPGVPRRVFTVDVVLDAQMNILSVDCHLGIIESKARISYDQAQCYIDAAMRGETWQSAARAAEAQPVPQGAAPIDHSVHKKLFDALAALNRFAGARAKMREHAGGVDFDTVEAKVQLDSDGLPVDVILRARTAATSCVEEAMILANECVARRLSESGTPGIYRVHDAPQADALSVLIPILQEFGYDSCVSIDSFVTGDPFALQAVLKRAQGRPEAGLVTSMVLRAQQRALYRTQCDGHYGLASEAYCHFTSPIRRYPDLVVHRMLRSLVQGRSETYQAECDNLSWLAEHSSKMERIAEAAARESQETKLVEYMQQFIGLDFDGIVSGVATYGLFVQLENTAEGVLPVRRLGDEFFSLDPAAHKLIGQDTGRSFRLGQRIRVRIQPSAPHARKLDLSLAR